jgi:hypothetical protein
VSPRIEQVADLRVACLTGEIDGTAQSIMQIVLGALLRAQAQESVGIVVMGDKGVVAVVSFFDDGCAVIGVGDIAAVGVFVPDTEACGIVIVGACNDFARGRAAFALDELILRIVGRARSPNAPLRTDRGSVPTSLCLSQSGG